MVGVAAETPFTVVVEQCEVSGANGASEQRLTCVLVGSRSQRYFWGANVLGCLEKTHAQKIRKRCPALDNDVWH